jgi:hypothetical protein
VALGGVIEEVTLLRAAGPAAAVAGAEVEVVLGPREAHLFEFSNALTERFPPGN